MSGHEKLIEGLRESSSSPIGYGCQGCTDSEREDAADALAALVAERDALKKALEWQPIETAPTDGMIVLGWWVNGEIHTGSVCAGAWIPAWDSEDESWELPVAWKSLTHPSTILSPSHQREEG